MQKLSDVLEGIERLLESQIQITDVFTRVRRQFGA